MRSVERSRMMVVPVVIAAGLLVAGFAHLHDYGLNWDEALGDLFFGQRYASFFATFDSRYLDFASEPYPPGHVPDFSMSYFRGLPYQYFPFANTLAYATSVALSGFLDPFDGFHAFNLLLGALFLIVFFRFAAAHTSAAAALAATLLLFTSPRIVYDLMVNTKDFPEMIFFSGAAMAFYAAWERKSAAGLIFAGVLWGFAMATKANALFFPFIVVIYIAIRRDIDRRRALSLMAAAIVGVLVLFATWPWLWSDPIGRFSQNLHYILARGTSRTSTISPWTALIFTTQPVFLVLIVIGLARSAVLAWRGDRFNQFVLVWFGVIAARISVPGSVNFDGVRHFLEIFPPLAIVAGTAVDVLPRWRHAVAILAAIPGIAGVISMHPYENAYWNALIGGPAGARERGIPQSGEYWATSYRQGIEWLNENAPPRSVLVVPIADQVVQLVKRSRLRPDIEVIPYNPRFRVPEEVQLGNIVARTRTQPVFVMFILRDEWDNKLTIAAKRNFQPVREWSRSGVPLMRIYQLPTTR